MRVVIPTEDATGLDARIHAHLGSSPFFTFVDTETEAIEVVPNPEAGEHGHGQSRHTCRSLKQPGMPAFDAVACRSMGRRALAGLTDSGVEVFVTRKRTVEEILEAIRSGERVRITSLDACEGRGEGRGGGRRHRTRHGHA